jgi:riboflavin synthase
MFTGLVEELGSVASMRRGSKSVQITIKANKVLTDVKLGDSIAVNGTCLTVVEYTADHFTADVMPETVDRTVLAALKNGDRVNLERTLAVGDRLGGHIVTGHIDGVGQILAKTRHDNAIIIRIQAPEKVMKYIIEKGSVAIDGISLTVVACTDEEFSVSLIPHTAAVTTLGIKKPGDMVNLETDILGKYVERFFSRDQKMSTPTKGITMDFLAENGY